MAEHARRALVELILDGYPVSGDFAPYLLDFTYAANASGKADEIQITLHNRDGRFSGEWLPKKGMAIEASIVCTDWVWPGESQELPCGTFKIDELDFTGPPDKIAIKAVSADLTGPLRDTRKTRAWENFSLEAIAAQIASENGLELYYSGPECRFERQDQRNEADIAFLNRLCSERSMNCKIHQGQIILFDADSAEKADASLVIPKTGGFYSPASYSFKLSSAGTDYTDAEAAYSDPKTGTTHKARVKSKKATHSLDSRAKTLTVQKRAESAADAASLARSELHGANVREQTASVEIIGCPALVAGQMVALEGFGVFSGSYFVKSATHKISGAGKYSTSLELQTAAPTETESAHDEKSEAALAAREEVIIQDIKRRSLSQKEKDSFEKLKEEVEQGNNAFHKLMISLPDIAAKIAEGNWFTKDRIGKIYLSEMLRKWVANKSNAEDAIEPFYIDLDWVLDYGRAKSEFMDFVQDSGVPYVLNKKARDSLCAVLRAENKVPLEKPESFDFINAPWDKLEDVYFTHRSVPGLALWPDGLFSALESFTFRALASGTVEPCRNGKFMVHVEKLAVYAHDVFNFDGSMYLGSWFKDFVDFTLLPIPGHIITNGAFQDFAKQTGYGHDFIVLSKPRVIDFFKGKSYECSC